MNVFLKACQEHFHLQQSNLFDVTDLEDLSKRRGSVSNELIKKQQHFFGEDNNVNE